ncbi:MAG TPA: hypothetical protein VMG14_03230 [Thermoplasmata archaeon]|nr:hypothetical protein [Thermoplasmata archaeon]
MARGKAGKRDPQTIVSSARLFLEKNARLLERLRFAHLFEGGPKDPILLALRAYRNADGGYGRGLEPDLRGPESEPIPVWTALGILDEIDEVRGPDLDHILRWLDSAEATGGGIPFVFRAARRSPHAPWWETGPGRVRGALNPTAGLAAYLYKNHIESPWLRRNATWCWERIERIREVSPYELRVVLAFLDRTPERDRAVAALTRLRPMVRSSKEILLASKDSGAGFRPLDFTPDPGTRSRSLFTEEEIQAHLDWILGSQNAEGGWSVDFPIWTPLTRYEWDGVWTLEMLKLLRSNGRLSRD